MSMSDSAVLHLFGATAGTGLMSAHCCCWCELQYPCVCSTHASDAKGSVGLSVGVGPCVIGFLT